MSAWAALREGILLTGGERVECRAEWVAAYGACHHDPLPSGYLDLLETFGPGRFFGFLHVFPPHRVQTYGHLMSTSRAWWEANEQKAQWDRMLVFARTDNGDDLAWGLGGRGGVEVRYDRSEDFVPFAETFEGFVRRACFEREPWGSVLRPWFTPDRPRKRVHLRFQGQGIPDVTAALSEWSRRATGNLGAVLLDADGSPEGSQEPWCSQVLHLPGADSVVHLYGVGDQRRWWEVDASGPEEFPEGQVRALVASGSDLGWPAAVGEMFDAAPRELQGTQW